MKKYTLYKSTYHFAFCVRCPCKKYHNVERDGVSSEKKEKKMKGSEG